MHLFTAEIYDDLPEFIVVLSPINSQRFDAQDLNFTLKRH